MIPATINPVIKSQQIVNLCK